MTMVVYRIERGVSLPGRYYSPAGRRPGYRFKDLKVGDSLFVKSDYSKLSDDAPLCAAMHKARRTYDYNLHWEYLEETREFQFERRPGTANIRKRKSRET